MKHPPVYNQYPQPISLRSVSSGEDQANGQLKDLAEDFTQEQFAKVWMDYAKKVVGHLPRLSSLLSSYVPQKPESGLTFHFTVSSQTVKEYIYKHFHNAMEGYLRTNLRNSNITLSFDVEGEVVSDSNMPYTSKEKYVFMLEKNPDLQLLQQAFGLETD